LKKIVVISLITLFITSCESKYPSYFEVEDDVYIKLLSFNESEKQFKKAKYASVSIFIEDNNNLIYRQYKEDVVFLENNKLSFLLKNLNKGDSAILKVRTSRISEVLSPLLIESTTTDFVEVVIKIHNYYSDSEYLESKNEFDEEMIEQLLLSKYIEEVGIKMGKGICKKVLVKGAGETVKKGDRITIAYKGYFINRLKFDEISGSTAFTFKYGTPGQVIKGLEIAIKSMREGEKSKIIIPSQLAFGEEGSTTLVVPSFTTVIYELEILKIN
jgi:FKBP-type peptidyl-prolyl cis-trans isomerase FkpA